MKRHREVEARWLDLDKGSVLKKLGDIGAASVGDFFFREWIFARPDWGKTFRRIRVRTDGKTTWLTYKANPTWAVDSTEEVEVTVSSAEDAVQLLQAADIPLVRFQEKKRKTFTHKGISFDVDEWPKIPMVLEIEAESEEKVKEGARLLGLLWSDAVFEDHAVVHQKYYGIDLFSIAEYRFDDSSRKGKM